MSGVFIDSNVIIKYFLGYHDAYRALAPVIDGDVMGYINDTVFSEVMYNLVRLISNKKPYELKRSPQYVSSITNDHIIKYYEAFRLLRELSIDDDVKDLAIKIMGTYGLLPNDALIAATCGHYGINTIITYDEDFKRIEWLRVVVPGTT